MIIQVFPIFYLKTEWSIDLMMHPGLIQIVWVTFWQKIIIETLGMKIMDQTRADVMPKRFSWSKKYSKTHMSQLYYTSTKKEVALRSAHDDGIIWPCPLAFDLKLFIIYYGYIGFFWSNLSYCRYFLAFCRVNLICVYHLFVSWPALWFFQGIIRRIPCVRTRKPLV